MAIVFMDSFQHYATASLTTKWTSIDNGTPTIDSGVGRWGGKALQLGDQDILRRDVPGASTYIVGFSLYPIQFPQSSAGIFELREGSTLHTQLQIDSLGRLIPTRNGTSVTSTTFPSLSTGRWYYIEQYITIHDTAGIYKVRIDETTISNDTSIDTRNGGTGVIDNIRVRGGTGSNWNWYCNDLILLDTSGSVNNNVPGDTRIECLFPDGNGNSSQLVGSDGNSVNNYLLVDETSPPDDTDYVESATVGNKDTYTFGNLASTSGGVLGVQTVPRLLKSNAGSRTAVTVARLSGTESDSSSIVLPVGVAYKTGIRETKPGGGAWSISDVNSAEFGIKVDS